MNPFLLQKQLKENSADLQSYCKDIQAWGEEMKRKEAQLKSSDASDDETNPPPLPRNKGPKKIKAVAPASENTFAPAKPKTPKDFNYWEKFDVEAECEKIDQEPDDNSELSDEFDEDNIDMAQEEKEKGNSFVKTGRWEDAIKCYSKAIELYNCDPTYYCNRAMCHLKLDQNKAAEADCTIAIQLDQKYVKAFYRRALARESLKQYKEAKADLEKLLEIEPENKESQKLLDKIVKNLKPCLPKTSSEPGTSLYQRPISKFTASRQKQSAPSTSQEEYDIGPAFNELIVEHKKSKPAAKECSQSKDVISPKSSDSSKPKKLHNDVPWLHDTADVELVKTITKLPKDRSRKPLKRIDVQEVMLKGG